MNQNTLHHDLLVRDIRIGLEEAGFVEGWLTYESMKREEKKAYGKKELLPDGLFLIRDKGDRKLVALELELFSKSKKRYKKIFDRYLDKESLSFLWYIVRAQNLGEKVLELWEEEKKFSCSNSALFFYSLLDQVLTDPREAFLYGKGVKKRLKELGSPSFSGQNTCSSTCSRGVHDVIGQTHHLTHQKQRGNHKIYKV